LKMYRELEMSGCYIWKEMKQPNFIIDGSIILIGILYIKGQSFG